MYIYHIPLLPYVYYALVGIAPCSPQLPVSRQGLVFLYHQDAKHRVECTNFILLNWKAIPPQKK